MRYVFHPEALGEYAEAVQYYTEQRVEVAQAFVNAISVPPHNDIVHLGKHQQTPQHVLPVGDRAEGFRSSTS
jgi:hypothetical protein